jgi:methylase of polypeptide subunit release factors
MYGSIIQFSHQNLADQGMLYLELHENHAGDILDLFDQNIWDTAIQKDYDNKSRFLLAKRK